MLARDLACAALGWALAAACWIAATRLPRSLLSDEFGADGLPRGLALVLAAVSTLIAVRALWARFAGRAPVTVETQPLRDHARALGLLALGVAYLVVTPLAGYAAGVALLLLATALYYGAPLRWPLVLTCVAGAAFFWLLFARVLGVSMPAAPWLRIFG